MPLLALLHCCGNVSRQRRLGSGAVVRHRSVVFQCAEVRRTAIEILCNGGQRHTSVDGACSRTQAEIQCIRVIELLDGIDIFGAELRDIYKNVVVHQDTVAILAGE